MNRAAVFIIFITLAFSSSAFALGKPDFSGTGTWALDTHTREKGKIPYDCFHDIKPLSHIGVSILYLTSSRYRTAQLSISFFNIRGKHTT